MKYLSYKECSKGQRKKYFSMSTIHNKYFAKNKQRNKKAIKKHGFVFAYASFFFSSQWDTLYNEPAHSRLFTYMLHVHGESYTLVRDEFTHNSPRIYAFFFESSLDNPIHQGQSPFFPSLSFFLSVIFFFSLPLSLSLCFPSRVFFFIYSFQDAIEGFLQRCVLGILTMTGYSVFLHYLIAKHLLQPLLFVDPIDDYRFSASAFFFFYGFSVPTRRITFLPLSPPFSLFFSLFCVLS